MTPLGHLAIAVLLADAAEYADRALACCLAGALLPDLIDKPLAAAGLAPVSHTVGHSVLVVGLAAVVVARPRFRAGAPLVVGWAGHVGADLVVAYPEFLVNYAWPALPPRPTPDDPVLAYWVEYALGPAGAFEASIVVGGLAALHAGRVGLPAVRAAGEDG